MGDHVQVVLDDLRALSSSFADQVGAYRSVAQKVSPPVVDSGGGALNDVMQGLSQMLAVLHEQMVTSIDLHAQRLGYARDSYERHDIDNRGLYDDLNKNLDMLGG